MGQNICFPVLHACVKKGGLSMDVFVLLYYKELMFGELGPISQNDPQFIYTLELQYGQISDSVLSPSVFWTD